MDKILSVAVINI
ncbi:putative membrane protein, partial [Yersinia pestis PY-42]